jgi:hypothetical protein
MGITSGAGNCHVYRSHQMLVLGQLCLRWKAGWLAITIRWSQQGAVDGAVMIAARATGATLPIVIAAVKSIEFRDGGYRSQWVDNDLLQQRVLAAGELRLGLCGWLRRWRRCRSGAPEL